MDLELKASMENVLRMAAPKPNQESTITSLSSYRRPNPEDINKKIEARVLEIMGKQVPPRLLSADISTCEKKFNRFESLFITGSAGTGKSYLASAILKEEFRYQQRAYYSELYDGKEKYGVDFQPDGRKSRYWTWVTVPQLLLELRTSFKDKSEETEASVIAEYSDVDTLVLDDLGAEKSSEFTIQSLYLIIDRRYSYERDTIITSNLSLGQISEKVGDRIASRIAGMCKVIELKGKDRRLMR